MTIQGVIMKGFATHKNSKKKLKPVYVELNENPPLTNLDIKRLRIKAKRK